MELDKWVGDDGFQLEERGGGSEQVGWSRGVDEVRRQHGDVFRNEALNFRSQPRHVVVVDFRNRVRLYAIEAAARMNLNPAARM